MSRTTLPWTSVRRKSRPLEAEGERLVVEFEQVEDRRLQVVHRDGMLRDPIAEFPGGGR